MADVAVSPPAAQLRLSSRRPQVINLSTLTAARSGVARSGLARSGYTAATTTTFDPFLDIVVNQDCQVQTVDVDELQIVLGLNSEPSTLTATLVPRGQYEVARGNEIEVWLGGIGTGVPLFAGHILTVGIAVDRVAHEPEYTVEATDYRWLLDRYSLVSKAYYNKGVNTIVADLLANFSDPASGFKPGYLDSSLGTVSFISFTNATITQCLQRLAETVDGGAFWHVDERKQVHIYAEPDDEANTITVADNGTWRHLRRTQDLTRAVNRVVFEGGGSETTAAVGPADTEIPVAETGWYDPSGGDVQAPTETITYTGISIGSGAGNLEGVTITEDIPQGTSLWNRTQADDTAAQAALAADLGGGQSGISAHKAQDHRLGYERTEGQAEALLDALKTPNTDITYDIVPEATTPEDQLTYLRPGRLMTASVTLPVCIDGSFRVRQVTLTPWTRTTAGELVFMRSVVASLNRRSITRLLSQVAEA